VFHGFRRKVFQYSLSSVLIAHLSLLLFAFGFCYQLERVDTLGKGLRTWIDSILSAECIFFPLLRKLTVVGFLFLSLHEKTRLPPSPSCPGPTRG
jgi:hypothetical protein